MPTRGRTDMLLRSIGSLLAYADDNSQIEWLFAFDSDDADSNLWCQENILPEIAQQNSTYAVYEFEPMGYHNLNVYLNNLAEHAVGDWLVFWNDDAVMQDPGWDTAILQQNDRFCIQAFDTHRKHPYSIFPIVPRQWFEILGHLSQHSLNDAYISQIAWMLDIMHRLDIRVDHQRFDLTGANNDTTYRKRIVLEGNPNSPVDFNHIDQRRRRLDDAQKIAAYLRSQGVDMQHWDEVLAGQRDPWKKMMESDVNNQMMRIA